jgi:ankyrin repeat protein
MGGVGAAALLPAPASAQFIETWKPEGIWKEASIGKIGSVRRYLGEGISINVQDKRGYTPLMHALNTFQKHIIADLLAAGADPNARDFDGISALALACRAGDAESAELLLKAGAKLEEGTLAETDAFAQAVKSGSPQLVEVMLNGGADAKGEVRGRTRGQWPVLVYAARVGSADVVELLVKRGIPVDTQCQDKSTALLHASLFGNMGVIKRLISLGADIHAEDKRGMNALRYSVHYGKEPAFRFFLQAGVALPRTLSEWLPTVQKWGNAETLQILAGKGVDIASKDPILTLAKAAQRGDMEVMDQELKEHFPSFYPAVHCVLFAAAAGGHVEVIERLNQYADEGEHLNCGDDARFTQLHHAVMAGHSEAVEYYLKHKASLSAQNCEGHTPLMLAAMLGRTALVERLIKAGARTEPEDHHGRNALDLARQHQQKETVAWLEQAGAKPAANAVMLTEAEAPQTPAPAAGKNALPAVTAAALPFAIHNDAWYPSVEAARDFGLALQAGLQDIEGLRWVERAEIEKAEAELLHSTAGLLSPGRSMGIGQWVKADLLVTGTLEMNEGLGRELTLRVVEAHRGDVLAVRRLRLVQPTGLPLEVTAPNLKEAAAAARDALGEARARLAAVGSQRVFAPLFIGNRTSRTNRLDVKVPALLQAVHRGAAGKAARVLNFQGSDEAAHETELAVSGLSQSNGEAWKGVADHYLWGWCEETGAAGTPFAEMPVRLVLELWSGGAETQTFSIETKQSEMEAAAEKLAAQLITAALEKPRPQPGNEDRLNAARILYKHAQEMISQEPADMRLDKGNPWLVTRWALTMRSLEAARFFAPEDAAIAATRLLQRWYDKLHFPSVSNQEMTSSNVFWNLWRRKIDWDEHLSRFGLEGLRQVANTVRKNDKVLFSVFTTAKDAPPDWHFQINQLLYSSVQTGNRGFPQGVPGTVRRKWCDILAASTADCLLRAQAEYTERTTYKPSFVEPNLDFFLPLEKRLELARMTWHKLEGWNADPSPEMIVEKRLELLRWYDEAGTRAEAADSMKLLGKYYSDAYNGIYLPIISQSGNEPPPGFVETPMPKLSQAQLQAAVMPKPKTKSKRFQVPIVPVAVPKEWDLPQFQLAASSAGSTQAVVALTCYLNDEEHTMVADWDTKTQKFAPIAPFPQKITGDLSVLLKTPDSLWIGGPVYGIGRFDQATKKFSRFTDQDGLPFGHVSHATPLGNEIYVAGKGAADKPMLAAWSAAKGWRSVVTDMNNKPLPMKQITELTSFGSRLYCLYQSLKGGDELYMMDTKGVRTRQPSPTAAQGVVCGMWAEERGLWILNKESVSLIPIPAAGPPVPQPPQTLRFPEDVRIDVNVPRAVSDGDWLWILGQEMAPPQEKDSLGGHATYGRLLAIHKPTHTYCGCIDVTKGNTQGFVVTPDAVYALVIDISSENAPVILKVDKAALIREALAK